MCDVYMVVWRSTAVYTEWWPCRSDLWTEDDDIGTDFFMIPNLACWVQQLTPFSLLPQRRWYCVDEAFSIPFLI